MKVIDAKNVKELLTSLAIVPNVITEKWLDEHTVNAIPVEWIKEEIRCSIGVVRDGDYDYTYASCILQLLERWEKENE